MTKASSVVTPGSLSWFLSEKIPIPPIMIAPIRPKIAPKVKQSAPSKAQMTNERTPAKLC